MNLLENLKEVRENKKALLAANFYNLETCKGIVQAAGKLKRPVILQLTPNSINYMGLKTASAIARNVSDEEGIITWLHLDHCDEIELIKRCLDEDFDSVMIDASDKEMDQNIYITQCIVDLAKPYNVNVEAELGYVPKPDDDIDINKFTEPLDVKRFVEETGVSSLAIAAGSKHGFYTGKPKLDIQRIAEIRKVTDAFLVLHGASGIPAEILKEAVVNGIAKVNIATDTKNLFMSTLKRIMQISEDIDLRNVFPAAISEIQKMIENKIEIVSN